MRRSCDSKEAQALRFNLMAWWGVRWLADFLLARAICTLADIEQHGLTTPALERHVVPLVLGLGIVRQLTGASGRRSAGLSSPHRRR